MRSAESQLAEELRILITKLARNLDWSSSQAVDDVVQECLLKVLQNLRSGAFQGRSSLSTYVYTIVRRTCVDAYRADRNAVAVDIDEVSLVDPGPLPDAGVLAADRRRTAARVLLALPRECRKLWRAVFFGRKTYSEVAQQMGLGEGSIKRRMWECRKLALEHVAALEK